MLFQIRNANQHLALKNYAQDLHFIMFWHLYGYSTYGNGEKVQRILHFLLSFYYVTHREEFLVILQACQSL
jgi:hypothetical protein